MNVTFHELAAIAITQETAAGLDAFGESGARSRARAARAWAVAAFLAVGSHAIEDALPHYYPLPSPVDAALSLALVAGWLFLVRRRLRGPLLLVAFAALLPDIVDHLPDDLRKLGVPAPSWPNFFPWHWRSGSGSYPGRTGPLWLESLVNHAIVLAFCAASIVRTRQVWRWPTRRAGDSGRGAPHVF